MLILQELGSTITNKVLKIKPLQEMAVFCVRLGGFEGGRDLPA
jgi:hypothetical protein